MIYWWKEENATQKVSSPTAPPPPKRSSKRSKVVFKSLWFLNWITLIFYSFVVFWPLKCYLLKLFLGSWRETNTKRLHLNLWRRTIFTSSGVRSWCHAEIKTHKMFYKLLRCRKKLSLCLLTKMSHCFMLLILKMHYKWKKCTFYVD